MSEKTFISIHDDENYAEMISLVARPKSGMSCMHATTLLETTRLIDKILMAAEKNGEPAHGGFMVVHKDLGGEEDRYAKGDPAAYKKGNLVPENFSLTPGQYAAHYGNVFLGLRTIVVSGEFVPGSKFISPEASKMNPIAVCGKGDIDFINNVVSGKLEAPPKYVLTPQGPIYCPPIKIEPNDRV
ncbi:MAG: hypothetical protein WCJ70_03680 [bacterium]